MKKYYPYLNDNDFLEEINSQHIKGYLVNITILDWYEHPIEKIEGKVISANITIDGNSSLRRTCNLSVVADGIINDLSKVDNLISINKKVSVQIGYINNTKKYSQYPIIYFPLGIYVIINPSITHNTDNVIISLQLKDKMCLLNGQCGGTIPASTVFDNYITIDDQGNQIISRPTIYQIIQQLVNHFGNEQLGKIIISDLDTRVKQVMKWMGSSPLYMVQKGTQYQMTTSVSEYTRWTEQEGWYDVEGAPFEYGYDVGYIFTDFTFPGELVCDGGASVVEVLDKIVAVLGNYEYFYDINGNFVFQQIKNYLNNSQSKVVLQHLNENKNIKPEDYLLDTSKGKTVYQFNDANLITSYNNIPQYGRIKNDFTVWGVRQSTSGVQIPIRYHLVIDKKPEIGNTYWAFQYQDPNDYIEKWHCPIRFFSKSNFPEKGAEGVFYYDEQNKVIYTWGKDESGNSNYIATGAILERVTTKDWRTQLYFQGVSAEPFGTQSNYYYTELVNQWPKIYNIQPDIYETKEQVAYSNVYAIPESQFNEGIPGNYYYCTTNQTLYLCLGSGPFDEENYQAQDMSKIAIPKSVEDNTFINIYYGEWKNYSDFKQETLKSPVNIDYFLDFIDSNTKVSQFSVNNIGRRSLVQNDNNVNCVFQPAIPDVILIRQSDSMIIDPTTGKPATEMSQIRDECLKRGQDYYQVPDTIYIALATGGTFNSGYDLIRQMFHQYTSYNESVSISCLPIYHLQPNTRIAIYDSDSNISGDYMISTINITLDTNSTMSINATRALDKI